MELDDSRFISLSVKDLTKYQQTVIQDGSSTIDPAVRPNPCNINKLHVVDSPHTHIGNKFITSHLTVQLPKEQTACNHRLSKGCVWWVLASVVTATLVLAGCLSLNRAGPPRPSADQTNPDSSGDVPPDWYYDRALMNMSTCPQTYKDGTAHVVVVDSMDVNCKDIDSCTDIIRSLPEGPHFYLKNGHTFEGFGWDCNLTDVLKVVFLSEVPSAIEMLSFNKLLHLGLSIKMLDYSFDVLPICCVGERAAPSRDVMNFIKTLTDFRNRECIEEHANCN